MKKISFFLNCAASAMFAIALTACNATEDNPTGFDPSLKNVTIQSGDTLSLKISEIAEKTAGDEIFVEIPAGVDTVYTGEITTPYGKKVTIVSDSILPTVIKATAPIILSNKIALKNVIVNAGALEATDNLFTYNAEPDESLKGATGSGSMYNILGEAVKFENVVFDSIPGGLIFDNGKAYVPEEVIIDNCIIQFVPKAANKNAFQFNTNNNGIKSLTIKNSSVYATGGMRLGYFVKYGNNARIDRFGYDNTIDKIEFHYNSNTFYGLCSNYFHNYGSALKNYAIFDVTDNIFYYDNTNNTQTKQIVQRIVGQANKATGTELNFDGNAFLYNGEPYDCNQETNKQSYNVDTNSVGLDPKFKDAAGGNFRPTNLIFLNFENAPGDPRWTKWVYKGI